MKLWPIIRHVRWAVLSWRFETWWAQVGCHLGAIRNPADEDFLRAVWDGRA